MRKVIWITSFFTPVVNVATARTAKLLKYLPNYDWEAIVIFPDYGIKHTEFSRALLNDLNASVYASPSVPDRLISLSFERKNKRSARYASYLMNNVFPPDGHVFWAISSLMHIEKQINVFKPDIVYTTCNPFSINLIGAWMKRKFHLPWVTDFRDLWTLNPIPKRFLDIYHQFVSSYLEKFYMNRCDYFIANTDNSKKRMIKKYPVLTEKIDVVPNGYDSQDIDSNKMVENIIPNSFLYSGSIVVTTNYHPLRVFKLLGSLEKYGNISDSWQLHYAGVQGNDFKMYAGQAAIKTQCIDHGFLDHKRYYKLIRQMDYIVMARPFGRDSTSWIHSRFYDYIENKKKIICLAHRGSEIFTLLKEYNHGISLYYEDSEEKNIKRLSEYILHANKNDAIPEQFVNQFTREKQAKKLSEIFNTVFEKKTAKYK